MLTMMMMKREVKGRTYTHTHTLALQVTSVYYFNCQEEKEKKKKKGRKNKLNKSIITNKQQRKQKNKFCHFIFNEKWNKKPHSENWNIYSVYFQSPTPINNEQWKRERESEREFILIIRVGSQREQTRARFFAFLFLVELNRVKPFINFFTFSFHDSCVCVFFWYSKEYRYHIIQIMFVCLNDMMMIWMNTNETLQFSMIIMKCAINNNNDDEEEQKNDDDWNK